MGDETARLDQGGVGKDGRAGVNPIDGSEMIAHDKARSANFAAQLFGCGAVSAFLSYLALSLLFFGRGVLANPAAAYLGRGPAPQLYIWFQAWWAYAISHRLNPS
jgi:hypothetical protein